jgi:hypothetical protein
LCFGLFLTPILTVFSGATQVTGGCFPTFPTLPLTTPETGSKIRNLERSSVLGSSRGLGEVSYLRTGDVAEILGVTKKTVKNWLKARLVPEPARNPVNHYRLWTLHDVEAVRRILSERSRG